MRSKTRTVVAAALIALCTDACSPNLPMYESGQLTRYIHRQREARDACLSVQVVKLDDGVSDPASVGLAASGACAMEDDKLITLLIEMDYDSAPEIRTAIKKDSILKATSIVLRQRAVRPKEPKH